MDTNEELIQFLLNQCNMSLAAAVDMVEQMQNKKILEQHPYKISQYSDGLFKTYVIDETKKSGRRQIAKHTLYEVEQAIIADYKQRNGKKTPTLAEVYAEWLIWRRDTGTEPKTILENSNEWRRFVAQSKIANKKVKLIKTIDLEDFFLSITKRHSITYRRLASVRGVLNGVLKYAIRQEYIAINPLDKLDFATFKRRCRAEAPKENYTVEERAQILDYLAGKTDVYSLAIQLSFYLCVRIGELSAIKREDVHDTFIFIRHAQRKFRPLNDDLSFGPVQYEVEERIKGNLQSGFRRLPLTTKAQQIVKKILTLYPEGEYLFERNGKPILADTFNERLQAVCKALAIPYRSSHQIRFTMATLFAAEGIPVPEISLMLGHSDTATTYHYIRQQQVSDRTVEMLENLLN